MESLAIGMLLGAVFVCILIFIIGMFEGDVDLSDIVRDYINEADTVELERLERRIVHEIVTRKFVAKTRLNNVYGRSIYDARTGETKYYGEETEESETEV